MPPLSSIFFFTSLAFSPNTKVGLWGKRREEEGGGEKPTQMSDRVIYEIVSPPGRTPFVAGERFFSRLLTDLSPHQSWVAAKKSPEVRIKATYKRNIAYFFLKKKML